MQNGVKMMRPVLTRKEYLSRRNTDWQRQTLKTAREQDATKKHLLVQMNYSCLPNPDGTLKGSKTASKSVGMDIDFKAPKELSAEEQQTWLAKQMAGVPELVMRPPRVIIWCSVAVKTSRRKTTSSGQASCLA